MCVRVASDADACDAHSQYAYMPMRYGDTHHAGCVGGLPG